MKNLMISSAAALLLGTTASIALPSKAADALQEHKPHGLQIASLSDQWKLFVSSFTEYRDGDDEDDRNEDYDDRYEDDDDDHDRDEDYADDDDDYDDD
jgi:ABC-type Zn2+ transport system substrate-binding protein/surface adhesin